MNYEDLSKEEQVVVDDVMGCMNAFLKNLKKEDYPKTFYVMSLFKDDQIFGRCIFLNKEDLENFRKNYNALTQMPKTAWGYAVGKVDNS